MSSCTARMDAVSPEERIRALEAALTNLMQKSINHVIAGYPANADALEAFREAERVITNRKS